MFEIGMYFSMSYRLCYFKDLSMDMLEEKALEDRYLDLNEDENIIIEDSRVEH